MPASSDGTPLAFEAGEIPALRLACVLPDAGAALDRYAVDTAFRDALRRRVSDAPESTTNLLRHWDRLLGAAKALDELDDTRRHLHLFAALGVLEGLVRHEPEAGSIGLALHRPAPGRRKVRVLTDEATLVLTPGSLVGSVLLRVALTPVVWALTAVAKPLLGQAVDIVFGDRDAVLDQLRARQVSAPGAQPLPPLKTFEADKRRWGAIVFVHGLFSTDLGLFDGLVARLRLERGLRDVELIGHPHNPLEPLDDSARSLADLITARLAGHHRAIAFVAHHRGGLVVRAAMGHRRPAWPAVLGCVSFGTPHTGIPGADNVARTLGAIARVAASDAFGDAPRGFMCLSDLLRLRTALGDADLGLADLLPASGRLVAARPRRGLEALEQQEAARRADDPAQALRIHAIGGNAPSEPLWQAMRPPGGNPDDWLVPTASSAPSGAAAVASALETDVDHRHYFVDRRGLDDAARRLADWFDTRFRADLAAIEEAARQPVPRPKPMPPITFDKP